MNERSMLDVAPTVSACLRLPAPAQAIGKPIPEIVSGLAGSGGIAVIAMDAMGMFAWNLWHAEMPYLGSLLARNGLIIRSILPSSTPMNFATMVAGTELAVHQVHTFNHNFACETLFDVVRKANGRSAGVGLKGYTGNELLGRYADIQGNAGNGTDDTVTDKVIEIAERDRPRFIIAQLGQTDDEFHKYGPSSPSVVPMLRATDGRLKRMVEHLKPLKYGIVILADHGQHDRVNPPAGCMKGEHGTDSNEDCQVPCTWL